MGELTGLEEIAQQRSIRVNQLSRRGGFGWSVSPNIERAAVKRESEKPPTKPSATSLPPPPALAPSPANLGRMFTDYRTLIETCRQRAEQLGISRLELDRIAGLPQGYSAKLLGKDGAGKKKKRIWPIGMESMLGALGLKALLIEDEAATARTLALREPVDRANQRFGNICRIKATLLPPPASNSVLRVVEKRPARGAMAERSLRGVFDAIDAIAAYDGRYAPYGGSGIYSGGEYDNFRRSENVEDRRKQKYSQNPFNLNPDFEEIWDYFAKGPLGLFEDNAESNPLSRAAGIRALLGK
jgi:hypothetical protein